MLDLKRPLTKRSELHVVEVGVNCIRPNPSQPRKVFLDSDMESLTHSIERHGVLQPLLVREIRRGAYELIAGERRLRAAKSAGLSTVPVIIRKKDDETSAIEAIIENIERKDLNFFEEAEALMRLMITFDLTQEETAKRIGRDQSTVANKMRILRLDERIRRKIIENFLTERHARLLLKVPAEKREEALSEIISRRLNVSQSEKFVSAFLKEKKKPRKPMYFIKDIRIFMNTINNALTIMRNSGINVDAEMNDMGDILEYTIHISKKSKMLPPSA